MQIKCATKELFNEIMDDCICGNKIFDYIRDGEEDFSYTVMEDKYVIVIYI